MQQGGSLGQPRSLEMDSTGSQLNPFFVSAMHHDRSELLEVIKEPKEPHSLVGVMCCTQQSLDLALAEANLQRYRIPDPIVKFRILQVFKVRMK
jgi:hypothetical protein